MDLTAHAAATDLTSRYPEAGTASTTALSYLALGLTGEASEVLEKVTERAGKDDVRAELGDTLWYYSRMHRELGLDPAVTDTAAAVLNAATASIGSFGSDADGRGPVDALVVAAGRVAELVKKALRDDAGQLTPARHDLLVTQLVAVHAAWLGCHAMLDLDPARTAERNIAKVIDRRDRGVLTGSGDRR